MLIAKRNMMSGKKLPYVRRLAYLESNGNAYIMTNAVPSKDAIYEAKFSIAPRSIGLTRNYIFGSASDTYNDRVQYSYSRQRFFGYGYDYTILSKDVDTNVHTVMFRDGKIYEDGVLVWTSGEFKFFFNVKKLALFAMNQGISHGVPEIVNVSNGVRIYNFKATGMTSLIPVMSYEGNPEMFDEVTQTFAERHGDFLYGELDGGGIKIV